MVGGKAYSWALDSLSHHSPRSGHQAIPTLSHALSFHFHREESHACYNQEQILWCMHLRVLAALASVTFCHIRWVLTIGRSSMVQMLGAQRGRPDAMCVHCCWQAESRRKRQKEARETLLRYGIIKQFNQPRGFECTSPTQCTDTWMILVVHAKKIGRA